MTHDKHKRKRKRSTKKTVAPARAAPPADPAVSAKDVEGYLRANADFFEDRPNILSRMSIPHGGDQEGVVSLIERQVSVLRRKNKELDQRLRELVAVARTNQELAKKMHLLSLALLDTETPNQLFTALYDHLTKNFQADRVVVRLFAKSQTDDKSSNIEFVGNVKESDLFKNIIKGKHTVCGRMTAQQRKFLFDADADAVHSSVVVPLCGRGWSGIMVIGSFDPDRFKPGMGVELLKNLADILNLCLKPWCKKA